jgi:hypothetical protein
MISIIICGRDNDISTALRHNIQETIGVVHEIIVIDNSQNDYSIFSAYNKGVALSNYDTLCFMHDDLVFESSNWGSIVINQLQQNNIGAVGVAGTPYYATLPGAWWSGGIICQHISGQEDYAYTKIIIRYLKHKEIENNLETCEEDVMFGTMDEHDQSSSTRMKSYWSGEQVVKRSAKDISKFGVDMFLVNNKQL